MIRLAVIFRRPLEEVQAWPAVHVDLLAAFLNREPSSGDRIDESIARLTTIYVQAHTRTGGPVVSIRDFLPYMKAWDENARLNDARYTGVDREIFGAFGAKK